MTEGAKKAKRESHVEMLTRLAANKDFMTFLGEALDEFCAFEQGYAEVDPFHQGVRAAGAWMIGEVGKTENGRKALAEAFQNHLTKNHKPEN